MATPATYNIPTMRYGTTYGGFTFRFTNTDTEAPIDLTGAAIRMDVRRNNRRGVLGKRVELTEGITMLNAADGRFRIDEWTTVDLIPGNYWYDIRITMPGTGGDVLVPVEGSFAVSETVTL